MRRMPDLTPAEHRVLLLMMAELDTAQIATRLVIARSTVKAHRMSLYRKTGTHNPVALASWGRRYFEDELRELQRLLHPEDEPAE